MLDLSELSYRPPGNQTVRPDKWKFKLGGISRGMSVKGFLFRVELKSTLYGYNYEHVFREFHALLTVPALKWYWQILENKANVYDFGYFSLTR